MVCVMLAGITLPPAALGVILALSLGALALCGVLFGATVQVPMPVYDTLLLAGGLTTITALISWIGVRGMALTLGMAQQARREAQRSEARYRRLVEQIPGMTFLAPIAAPFSPAYASPQIKAILGFSPEEWTSNPDLWMRQIHPDDRARVDAWMEPGAVLEPGAHEEYRMLDRSGNIIWLRDMRSVLADDLGTPQWFQALLVDATSRKQVEERLLHAATHDSLTRLPNRAALLERISGSLAHVKDDPEYGAAILFLDLDKFKQVNDTLGHAVGDQLLQTVAQRLSMCVRSGDLVGRLGGDEFVVVLDETATVPAATRVAERIKQSLGKPVYIDGHMVLTAASIGIAVVTADYAQAEDILRDADIALYRAKSRGKGCYVLFEQNLGKVTPTRRRLADGLRLALVDGRLQVYYQPIVRLSTGQISDVEALARWSHPDLGWISPAEFIPIAEEAGLIEAVGERVLRLACAQLHMWQTAGLPPCVMTVNLSAHPFQQRTFSTTVAEVLKETGVEGRFLKLEIRESDAMLHAETNLPTLEALKALGVQLSVDDFGSGCSSLSSLRRFAIDTLKIDGAFVRNITAGPHGEVVVKTILAIAHSLHWDVIAEGVETEAQLEFLRAHGCDAIQGFLFSQAVPGAAMTELLAQVRPGPTPTSADGAADAA